MTCSCCKRDATWKVRTRVDGEVGPIIAVCDRCMAWAARIARELGLALDILDLDEVGADGRQLPLPLRAASN